MSNNVIETIERIGYVNEDGRRVYGTAAVLHYMYMPVDDFVRPDIVEKGRELIEKYLSMHI